MKLIEKKRIGGHVHKKYDKATTPYKRIMTSDQVDAAAKERLRQVYLSLNPAELKRQIIKKLDVLFGTIKRSKC